MMQFDCTLARRGFRLNLAFDAGDGITALFGPSGSGKTTALRIIAGLERVDRGRVSIDGDILLDTARAISQPAHRRRIGLVFQDAKLFPHLSVRANLLYGRFFAGKDTTDRGARRLTLPDVVEILGIGHLLDRRPESLSGGETQRVAIGRAILASPRLLLMDEPLASLDSARKLEILPFIERLRDSFAIPIIYVSHSAEEVARLAAHVVMLSEGAVTAAGAPGETLGGRQHGGRADRFAEISVLKAEVSHYLTEYGVTVLRHPAGEIIVPGNINAAMPDIRVSIQATSIVLGVGDPGRTSARTVLSGRIIALEPDDSPFVRVTIALAGGDHLTAIITRLALDALGLAPGDAVQALVKSVAISESGIEGHRINAKG